MDLKIQIPEKENQKKIIAARVSDSEFKKIDMFCKKNEISISVLIRKSIEIIIPELKLN